MFNLESKADKKAWAIIQNVRKYLLLFSPLVIAFMSKYLSFTPKGVFVPFQHDDSPLRSGGNRHNSFDDMFEFFGALPVPNQELMFFPFDSFALVFFVVVFAVYIRAYVIKFIKPHTNLLKN